MPRPFSFSISKKTRPPALPTSSASSSAEAIINSNPDMESSLSTTTTTTKPPRSIRTRFQQHLKTDVSTNHADLLLLVCCLISGLVDSTIYNAFGTFVSMQTGNTIFVGLGASSSPQSTTKPYGWAKSLTSVLCFTLGAFFFSRLCRLLHPRRRGTLATSFFIQALFVIISTILFQSGAIDSTIPTISSAPDIDWRSLVPIILLSFQAAGQLIGSRVLDISEIPTVVVTSLLCDTVSDPHLFGSLTANAKRNRRVLAFLSILVGAIVGGWIARATGGVNTALWIAAGGKVCIAISWIVWPPSAATTAAATPQS